MDTNNKNNNQQLPNDSQNKQGFFQSFISSLFKSSNPEVEKKKKLKAIAKEISKSKYHAFYKPSASEVSPAFGKFFYDIYKVISQAQVFFKNTENPEIFKRQIINYVLSENQLKILDELDEQNIIEISKKIPIAQLEKQVEDKLQAFSNDFDAGRSTKTDNLYHAFTLFRDFCMYDYYVVIRKFNANFQEYGFSSQPNFEKITAEYICDELKDFIAVSFAITDPNIYWEDLFDFFKNAMGKEFISLGNWKKVVAKIRAIQVSNIWDLMIRHISQNPKYISSLQEHSDFILEPYLDKIMTETRNLLVKIKATQKEDKANSICQQIFSNPDIQTLKYYTSSLNSVLEKKGLSTFDYYEPLNYLKAYLLEHVKKEMREFYDVVVIRGQWDATLSAPISNAYQELLKISDSINAMDESFSEEGPSGAKIKNLLPKTAHDHGAENIINRVVDEGNEAARGYILTATQNLVTFAKTLKQLIEDYSQKKPVIVQNWKDLEKFVEGPMKTFCVNIYKSIYLFVQLMQTYIE